MIQIKFADKYIIKSGLINIALLIVKPIYIIIGIIYKRLIDEKYVSELEIKINIIGMVENENGK